MRVVVAPDSFKGSLKSPDAARAIARGVRTALPDAEVIELPVGDGGEGTLEALVAATDGTFQLHTVAGPLGEPLPARLGLLGDGQTVLVEMAEASGLSRLPPGRREPLHATTRGTGELIRAAFDTGRPCVLIGIGGSATTDGGAGMLQALGLRLLDDEGDELGPGGVPLSTLAALDRSAFSLPPGVEIIAACDVTNPLTGPHGAAAIFGPQKGAGPDDIRLLDDALARFADVTARELGRVWREEPGAGAAGGMGFALLAFLGARLERGVDLVLDTVRFDDWLQGTDLLITGEGRIDRQTTAYGKTLTGIGARAQRAGVPVLALAGSLGEDLGDYGSAGISGVASILPRPMPLDEAMRGAEALVEDAARRLVEVFKAGSGLR